VVVRHPDALEVAEANGRDIAAKRFSLEDIDRVTFGKVLLRAWLGFEGETSTGTDAAFIEFNTVTARLFQPLIDAIRPAPSGRGGHGGAAASEAAALGLKFVNYAETALRDGDVVELAIAQPEIADEGERWAWRRKPKATARLLLLTDREVIVIGDDEDAARRTRTRHGGTWTYVPRSAVERTLIETRGDGLFGFELQLRCGDRVRGTFDAERRPLIEQLSAALRDSR
jgi:hypothetical protein